MLRKGTGASFQIFLGWAGDRAWVNASIVYAVCMALCGAVTALIPVVISSYYTLCAISGAFGLFIGANYSLTSIILVELITLERFTNAYGLLLLVQGVANLMGPPLAGKGETNFSSILNELGVVIITTNPEALRMEDTEPQVYQAILKFVDEVKLAFPIRV